MMRIKSSLAAALTLACVLGLARTADAACGKASIAEMTWDSAAVAAYVVDIILAKGYGCETEVVPGDTIPTLTSMTEKNEPDIAPELWVNSVRDALDRAVEEKRIAIAGEILLDGAVEGWYVPAYVVEKHPELTTLQAVLKRPDLFPDKEEAGKGRFYNCPSGWACEIINGNLFKAYGLEAAGFTLFNPGSGEGLAAAIAGAYERRQPIFAYYWAPTALISKYPMVRLGGMVHNPKSWGCIIDKDCADPQPNMYPKTVVFTATTDDFRARAPEAFAFAGKFAWTNALIHKLLAWKDVNLATPRETAEYFLKTHPDVWTAWVSEEIATKVKASLM